MPIYVKDIMSSPALTIDWNKSVKEAARLMTTKRRGYLVVTRKNKAIGVISDSDILRHVVAKNKKGTEVKVKQIMTSPVITASPSETIVDAVRKMKRNNIHRLPVVEGEKVLGVITLGDIARTSPELLDLLEYRLKMKEMPIEMKEKVTVGFCEECGNYSENLRMKNGVWVCEKCFEEEE